MNIYYHASYNIDLGLLNYLHPFDGKKYQHVCDLIAKVPGIKIKSPTAPASDDIISPTQNDLLVRLIKQKRYLLRALELPYIPLLPYSVLDKRILLPMRWGVAGTLSATLDSLSGSDSWNLAGGYHHASPHSAEGFCIYNDIAITYNEMRRTGFFSENDRILIIDVDAHHGNGNAYYFMDNKQVTILDIYNDNIYPRMPAPKARVDIAVPLATGTTGANYLEALSLALHKLEQGYRLAFVIAGTDVLANDPLGGFQLDIADCVSRDKMIVDRLRSLSIPMVILGGGGYTKDSAKAISRSITELHQGHGC